ncbi:hypothetical protein CS006_03300 [Bifidobacterium primatium]|uniref:Uncharacterized protein n=1 Tax=Bifidobacterium primatium TaxID=2045438 RepID=A0A2M9HBI0_9BIFI|nr:HTH domain-containing protein [Bifidobacterium primatium]PJM74170.1 hypothetical protein CS006_03300 [Bifidobacterium primatium]
MMSGNDSTAVEPTDKSAEKLADEIAEELAEERSGGKNPKKRFTLEQQAYLRSLPAVREVSETRIQYSSEFRRHCVERYRAGASPTELFREAGLSPTLIGAKRIERCIARWKKHPITVEMGADPGSKSTAASASVATSASAVKAKDRAMSWYVPTESGMVPELVISQQSHYIVMLEQRIAELECELAAGKTRHARHTHESKAGAQSETGAPSETVS